MTTLGRWRTPGYQRVGRFLAEHAGLATPSQPRAIEDAVDRAIARAGVPSPDALLQHLLTAPQAVEQLLNEVVIGETYFFRTPEHFDFVRSHVLPQLERSRLPDQKLRVWSAGCASGEEAYSLAVLLAEEGFGDRMEVLGTDVSTLALGRAKRAEYGEWSLRGPDAHRIRPYLEAHGRRYHLKRELRRRVRFAHLNLAEPEAASRSGGGFDLIFCRNVLIYFTPDAIRTAGENLLRSLNRGGFLLLGPSDPPLPQTDRFEVLLTAWGVALRRPVIEPAPGTHRAPKPLDAPAPLPLAPAPPAPPPAQALPPSPPPPPRAPPSPAGRPSDEARHAMEAGRWADAAALAGQAPEDTASAALRVRALANVDLGGSERACAEALARHPLDVELRHLHGLLLLSLGRLEEAEAAARKVVYLAPRLAMGELTLAHVLSRRGDRLGALRAYRVAIELLSRAPEDAPVALLDGERVGRVLASARRERMLLEAEEARDGV